MIDKNLIGVENPPVFVEIEKGVIRKFAKAIGDDNPIYHNEKSAMKAGYPSIVAPLTFPTTFRDIEPEWYTKLEKSRLLHGEQVYEYSKRFCAGETIKFTEKIADTLVKEGKNGKLTFIVRQRKAKDLDDNPLFIETQTLVVRE